MTAAIQVRELTFRYPGAESPALARVSFDIEAGARCLLAGANGAGKTTLLAVLAGRHLVPDGAVQVLGRPAFSDTGLVHRVAFIGGGFPFRADISVDEVLRARPDADPRRRADLLEILGIDPGWRMVRVSDGQRRRVQILLSLLAPREVVLLDEATSDLDVIARSDLLAFLRLESERRGATLLYATHVFDGLEDLVTHVAYLDHGAMRFVRPLDAIEGLGGSSLRRVVEAWLRADCRTRRT